MRQSGRSTEQMRDAPRDAVYIAPPGARGYMRKLARKIEREDLKIVGPEWLNNWGWKGLILTGIVRDHAVKLTKHEFDCLQEALTRVRDWT